MFHSFHNCCQSFFVQPQTQTWIKEAGEKKSDICSKETKTTAASLLNQPSTFFFISTPSLEASLHYGSTYLAIA